MVRIDGLVEDSAAARAGVKIGDELISIDGHEIHDVLDYRFYLTERKITLLLHRGPELVTIAIEKERYSDIGLIFDDFLMDQQRSCRNKCIFCFIDQLPRGMREPLYFKDDDSRMSFLAGSYVTLTNMSDAEIDRIAEMKIAPIHISVHTTNPTLRVEMMKNPRAGEVMTIMRRFADAGIEMHAQIVLCKGYNDGAELERSMTDLSSLFPALASVSVVPVGLTKHRETCVHLEPFDAEDARKVLAQICAAQERFLETLGTRLVYASDEWYLRAGREMPAEESYEGYPQLDNGVGMIRLMDEEIADALSMLEEDAEFENGTYSVATGMAAYPFLRDTVERLNRRAPERQGRVYAIRNDTFGEQITVAGLITGGDLVQQLAGQPLGERLYLPYCMLRYERDLFLDGMTPEQVSKKLGVEIVFVEQDGYDFVNKLLPCKERG